MRDFFERVHRRTGSGYCQLHYRGKCYRPADGEEIRNQQEYGTCGGNNIEWWIKKSQKYMEDRITGQ